VQQLIAQLPWGHNVRVSDRIKDRSTREWYLRAALEHGWSQDVLVLQIKSGLREREGKALTNFQRARCIGHSNELPKCGCCHCDGPLGSGLLRQLSEWLHAHVNQ
jgi:hypothetical protein